MTEPDLKYLAHQLECVLNERVDMRDAVTVVTAICTRLEAAISALTVEVRAVSGLEDRPE